MHNKQGIRGKQNGLLDPALMPGIASRRTGSLHHTSPYRPSEGKLTQPRTRFKLNNNTLIHSKQHKIYQHYNEI